MTTLTTATPGAATGRAPRRDLLRRLRTGSAVWLLLAPVLVSLLVLRIIPAGIAIVDSLRRGSVINPPHWVGLENFATLFGDPTFHQAVGVTLLFAVVINPLQVAVALGLAMLFTRGFPGTGPWRTLVIIPIAVPPAVSATVFGVIYRPDGLANAFFSSLGIGPQGLLTSPNQALACIIVLLSWVGVGYWMLYLIAGINDIPTSLYEAAEIDGANSWQRFRHVTLPMLRRPLAFVLVADTVSNFLVFAPVQQLTNGGPQQSTNLIMFDVYTRAYTYGDLYTSQAEVVVLMAIMLVVVGIQFRLLGER